MNLQCSMQFDPSCAAVRGPRAPGERVDEHSRLCCRGVVLVAAGMGPGFAVGAIAATSEEVPAEQGPAAALLSSST
jgi:hypothetical protein